MLPAYALASLSELKAEGLIGGSNTDLAERSLARASRIVEEYLRRRIVFRAPTDDDDRIVASTPAANGALTVAANPPAPGRVLVVTVGQGITGGTLSCQGTVAGANATKTFDLSLGVSQLYGVDFFTAVSAATISGLQGAGSIKVGTSEGYVEYHTPAAAADASKLWPLEYPIRSLLAVYEDSAREYAASTLLTADQYIAGADVVRRVSGPSPACWMDAWRAMKLIYAGGCFTAANVPADIKDVALRLAVRIYREADQKRQDAASVSDDRGSVTRFGPASLTEQMRAQLAPHRAWGAITGERDFDLEAA